jgi:hypothetical protein
VHLEEAVWTDEVATAHLLPPGRPLSIPPIDNLLCAAITRAARAALRVTPASQTPLLLPAISVSTLRHGHAAQLMETGISP